MISFENIKTGEVVTFNASQNPLTRQAHIAAYLNSSNMSPNALKGQDFGWRLAPEIVDKIETLKTDLPTLTNLSRNIGVPIDELRDFHLLNYIAEQEFAAEALRVRQSGESNVHEQSYEERVKALRARREQPQTYEEEPVVAPRPVRNMATEPAPQEPVIQEITTTVAPEAVPEVPDADPVEALASLVPEEPEVTEETATATAEPAPNKPANKPAAKPKK
jgi:hypothetical protein